MKLTESQLRKIIREELEAVRKGDPSLFRSIAKAAGVSLDPRGPSALDRARGVKGLAPAQIERFNDIVNQVQRGELERDEAVKMIKDMVHGTMDEAIENYELFFDEKVKPLFAPHAPKNAKERAAFFQRVRRKIGTRKLDDIKKNILSIATQAK